MSLSHPITVLARDGRVSRSRETFGVTFRCFLPRKQFAELQHLGPESHPNPIIFVAIQGSMMSLTHPITVLPADKPVPTSRETFGVTSL